MSGSVDVVTILWERTSLIPLTQRTIVQASVIGSAAPCKNTLDPGDSYRAAVLCLLGNRFVQVLNLDSGLSGVAVFIRLF
ncbi:hypothetical protein [Peribacillus simplex]|uniref:Uncharacterized protein n=1 Tax=Peribacillus simplex TaxID=1478 RepID=A0A9W4L0U8_9BACI|nr:hypothetical protein [Peribacillus simplex]MDR4927317.1 hypothetical protein [Peribacillus simplex]WHX92549.1 hypothetical protein QNH50_06755 [Peribacillus simplex]CAH0232249.1 hypothetical protein SRABI133_02668 [Peribacillus simplex]